MNKKNTLNYPKSAAMFFFQGPKNEFETAVVNEPSVFEPLKFYCSLYAFSETINFRFAGILYAYPLATVPPVCLLAL